MSWLRARICSGSSCRYSIARMAASVPAVPRQRRPGHKPCLPRMKRRAVSMVMVSMMNDLSSETVGYEPDYITLSRPDRHKGLRQGEFFGKGPARRGDRKAPARGSALLPTAPASTMIRYGVSWVLKNLSYPCQDVMNALRKSGRSNFDQVVAQREVGCFMDALEHERFFKRDFSRRSLLAEPQMFDEEHLPLINPLTLNSREFLSQSRRGRIAQIAGKREGAHGRTVIPLEVGRSQRRFELPLFLETHNGIDEVGPQVRLQIAT